MTKKIGKRLLECDIFTRISKAVLLLMLTGGLGPAIEGATAGSDHSAALQKDNPNTKKLGGLSRIFGTTV